MALIECPDCQTAVSDLAPSCLKCGRPIAHPAAPSPLPQPPPVVYMAPAPQSSKPQVVHAKRTFNGILAMAWLLGFAGCVSCLNQDSAAAAPFLLAGAFIAWVVSRFYTYG